MARRIIVSVMLLAVCLFFAGCKKDSGNGDANEPVVKSEAEYKAQAQEQINSENMSDELDNLEESIDGDVANIE